MNNDTASSDAGTTETQHIADWKLSAVSVALPPTLFDPEVGDGAFRMYATMLIMASAKVNVTRKSLAESLSVSTRTIYTREAQLVKAGLLRVTPQYSSDGGNEPSLYTILTKGESK